MEPVFEILLHFSSLSFFLSWVDTNARNKAEIRDDVIMTSQLFAFVAAGIESAHQPHPPYPQSSTSKCVLGKMLGAYKMT